MNDANTPQIESDSLVRKVVTHDADEQAGELYRWHQLYDQLTSGRFVGSIAEIRLDEIQVFCETTNQALRQTCEVPVDACWFGIPVTGDRAGRIQSSVIHDGLLAFRPGGMEFELITPPGYQILGVVASRNALRRHAEIVEQTTSTGALPHADVAVIGNAQQARLITSLTTLLAECAMLNYRTLCGMQESLKAAVLTLLFDSGALQCDQRPSLPSPSRRRAIVSNARQYVLANLERPVTVPELCKRLYVSRRTLQYCFQEILGMAPTSYLRAVRLNGARRELRQARHESVSVQDVAAAWGFWHFSQFAVDYRKLFGVKPSQTLRETLIDPRATPRPSFRQKPE
jgi:AraC family ethanolamine operon transcriptional activator